MTYTTATPTTTAASTASARSAAATRTAATHLAATTAPATTLAAALVPTTAARAPTTTATGTAAGAPGRAGEHGIRGGAKTVIGRTAESVEDGYDNEGNSHYKESVLGGILSRLLSPEPFEDRQHGNTFDSEGTLGIASAEKTTGNNIPHVSPQYKGS